MGGGIGDARTLEQCVLFRTRSEVGSFLAGCFSERGEAIFEGSSLLNSTTLWHGSISQLRVLTVGFEFDSKYADGARSVPSQKLIRTPFITNQDTGGKYGQHLRPGTGRNRPLA